MNERVGLEGTVVVDGVWEMLNVVMNDNDWMRTTFGEMLR